MSKKVDFFKADKAMAERVAQFMRVKVWNITLKARLEKAIKDAEVRQETFKQLSKDTGKDYTEVLEDIAAVLEKAKADYQTAIDEAETFDYTEGDLRFYGQYKTSGGNFAGFVVEWFKNYKLDVAPDSQLVQTIVEALKGSRKLSGRGVVKSNAERFTNDVRSKNDILTVFYGKLAEAMLAAGTLKPEAIPEDVRAFYAPSKKSK